MSQIGLLEAGVFHADGLAAWREALHGIAPFEVPSRSAGRKLGEQTS